MHGYKCVVHLSDCNTALRDALLTQRRSQLDCQVAGIRGPQRTEERASAMRGLLAPLDMPQLLKKALAERQPGASTLFWKLVLLQSPSTSLSAAQEWMSTKLLLNR